MKITIIMLAALILVGTGCAPVAQEPARSAGRADHKNIAYSIEGRTILLKDGSAETDAAPDAATKTITRHFGNEVRADFDADGSEDVAFILTQDPGGSGTFFYLAAALGKDGGYVATNTILIGDRISPQTTEFRDGEIIVNYAERKTDASAPSAGVSRYFRISGGTLVESLK